jgi:D-psicose/D-tagatose/L-ribulose 3-epimerase
VNKIGIHYAYWMDAWTADFHPLIDKVAILGFDAIEVDAGPVALMSTEERKRLKAHADERGITLTYGTGMRHDQDLASEDRSVRQRGITLLQRQAKAIGEMGGGCLSGVIYSAWQAILPNGVTDKRPFVEQSAAAMREAVKAAEEHGVIFNMEVVNRFETYMLNTSAEAVAYVEMVGSDHARILLDTYHMNIEEDFIDDAVVYAGDKLGHVHFGESNRRLPGNGHIPWTEVAAALRKIGYGGAVVMEPFVRPGGQVGRDIRIYRDLSIGSDLDEEARLAVLFTRGLLK